MQIELPVHPVTGLTALGMGRRGPIWPVIGGSGEGDGGGAGSGDGSGGGDQGGSGAGAGAGDQGSGDDGTGGPGTDQFKSEESKQSVLKDLKDVREENKRLAAQVEANENEKLSADEKRDKATQKIAEERDTAVSDAAAQRKRADRYEAAEKAGLELKYAKRIAGETLDEMIADAKELAKDVPGKSSGEYTPGTGTAGDGGAALTSPGVGTLDSYYANSKK